MFGPISFQFRHLNGVQALSLAGGVRTAQAGTSQAAFFKTQDGRLLAILVSNHRQPKAESFRRFNHLVEYFGSGIVVRDTWPLVTLKAALQPLEQEQWQRLVATRPMTECVIVVEHRWRNVVDSGSMSQLVADVNLRPLIFREEEGMPVGEMEIPEDISGMEVFDQASMTLSCRSAYQTRRQTFIEFGETLDRNERLARVVEAALRAPVVDPSLARD